METGQGHGKNHEKSSKEDVPCLNMPDMQCPLVKFIFLIQGACFLSPHETTFSVSA